MHLKRRRVLRAGGSVADHGHDAALEDRVFRAHEREGGAEGFGYGGVAAAVCRAEVDGRGRG